MNKLWRVSDEDGNFMGEHDNQRDAYTDARNRAHSKIGEGFVVWEAMAIYRSTPVVNMAKLEASPETAAE